MKVAYVIPGCGVSGGIGVVCQHANRLLARGHDVSLVSITNEDSIDWFPNQNAPIFSIQNYPEDIDILVATGWSTSFALSSLRARRKFYFVQSDETRFHPENSIWRHITRLSYTMDFDFITEAKWIQKWLQDSFAKEAMLVPNGLDQDIFYPTDPIIPKTKVRVLLEGAIGLPYKGMFEAFQAVGDLDVEVWCISSFGKPEPEWKCERFFKQVPMTEMKKIYSSCDILLKLSRVEGFFGPPLEMMACEGAVVVGKVTGYDEYIVDGFNALVVDSTDIEAAKAAVARLVNDENLRKKLIENGKKTAASWSWDKSIDILEKEFEESLHSDRFYNDALNESISFFYGCTLTNSFSMQSMIAENAQSESAANRMCSRLMRSSLFVLVSNVMDKMYQYFKKKGYV